MGPAAGPRHLAGRAAGRLAAAEHRAYHEVADAERLYRQRGIALAHLVGWCDEALALLDAGR